MKTLDSAEDSYSPCIPVQLRVHIFCGAIIQEMGPAIISRPIII